MLKPVNFGFWVLICILFFWQFNDSTDTEIVISRASCSIAGNHHQFRFTPPPPKVSSKPPSCCNFLIGPSPFSFLHNNWFLLVPEVNDLGNNCLDYLSVYQKIKEGSFWKPPPNGVVYFLTNTFIILLMKYNQFCIGVMVSLECQMDWFHLQR